VNSLIEKVFGLYTEHAPVFKTGAKRISRP